MDQISFQIDDFVDRARARLDRAPPSLEVIGASGDHAVDPSLASLRPVAPGRPAAVLIGVVDRPEPAILLTQRTAHLSSHAGQIAFPGGKIDASDTSPLATALREAEEEIGLHARHVEPLGYLGAYHTSSGFSVVPVVALVRPDFALTLNANEVAEAFEVPLAFLMDPANHQEHQREWRGAMRRYFAMPFGERYIWGVTAGILRDLHARLYGG